MSEDKDDTKPGRNWGLARQLTWVWKAVFSVWNLEKETGLGLREEEEKRREEREGNRKQSAVSHTGGEVEPLARILLAMSAIWNVESLPLSALLSNRVVLCLSAPSLCSDSTLKNRWRPRQYGRDSTDKTHTPAHNHPAWKWDPRSSPHPARHTLNGIWAWKKQRQLQSSAELFGGCSYSLIWQQSWEIIWISLVSVACLSGFSADWVPSGMFLSLLCACVSVWAPCVRFDLFVLPFLVLLFLLFACGGFVLGQEEGLCLWLS